MLAGTNRRSYFETLMDNYERVLELQESTENASGQLAEANQVRVESLEGIRGQLEVTKEALYGTILTDEGMKSILKGTDAFLQGVTSLIQFIKDNAIPTLTALGTTLALIELKMYAQGKGGVAFLQGKISDFVVGLGSAIESMGGAGKTVNILSKSFELSAFQVGLAKVAMGGLAVVAATLAVKVGVELYKAFKNATPSVEELQSKLNDLKSSMQEYNQAQEKFESVKVDVSSMKEMVNTINDENASWKEQQELTQQVNEKLAQHASSYSSIEGLLKNENIALETRIALLEKQAEIEANSAQLDTLGQLREKDGILGLSGTVIDQLGNSVDKALEELNSASVLATHYTDEIARLGDQANKELIGTAESYQKQLAERKSTVEQMAQLYLEYFSLVSSVKDKADPIEYKGWMDQLNAVKQALEQASEDYGVELKLYLDTASLMEQSEEVNGAVESVVNKISELSASMNEGVEAQGLTTSINSLVEEMGALEEGSEDANTVLKHLHSIFSDMPDDVDTLSEAIGYLNGKLDETSNSANMKGFNESYLGALEGIEDARELLDSFKDGLTTNEMRSLFDSDLLADYNGVLTDSVSIQEHLNNKIAEMQGVAADAYFEMNKNSEEFWNNQIKNSQSWIDYEKQTQDELTQHLADSFGIRLQDFEVYINEKGGLRDVDLSNAKNLSEAERIVNSDLNSQLLTLFAGFVNEKADARIDDMDNVVAFLKAQEGEEIKTIQQLAQLWNEYYNAKKAEINATISTLKKVDVTATQVKTDALNQMNDILSQKGLTNPNNHYQSLYGQATQLSQDVQKATQELEQLETENNKFQSVLNKLNNYGGSATNTLKQNYVGANSNSFGGSSGSGSGSSSGKGSSGSSSSEKEVADLELAIDRYYELNDALEDVNNALEKNSIQRDNANTIEEYNKLVEEEIKLTNQKIQALENLRKEQEKEASELKSALSSQGIAFDGSGNITNYSQRLQQLQDQANKLSGTAKETAIANVNAVKDMIDEYTTLTNSTIPGTTNQILEMQKAIENIRKEQEEMVKQVEKLGERYYTVLQAITKIDNQLSLISAKQENAHGQERVELLNQEIELLKEKQKLIQQQQKEMTVEATELYEELKSLNVEFDEDGYIKNYDSLIKKLKDQANKLVGDARDGKVEEAEKLIELIEKYDDLVKDSLPSLGVEWIELNNEIIALEKSKLETVADVEKQITNAITSELQKRTDATKKEIEKQKQLYLDVYEEEDYQTELAKEQRKLDEIQQQINNLARDTSLAGQLKLQDLMQQYQEQQDVINNMIRDHEKQQGSDRFDEEMDKLDEKLENALEPENMAQLVADALTTGLVTVGDEIIQLDQLMADFAVESEGAITALSNTIRAEMVESLREAQGLINDLGMSYRALIGYNETLSQTRASQNVNSATSRSIAPSVEFNAPILTVEGDITQDIDSRLSDLATQVQNTVMKTVTKALNTV